LGTYLNQKLGKKIDVIFDVVEIKGTSFLMPTLPDDDSAIERLTTSIERRLSPETE
jgi:hypothetical protein